MAIHFEIIREGDWFFAKAAGEKKFEVGRSVRYVNKKSGVETRGLSSSRSTLAKKYLYKASDYAATSGFWAEFIEPTALCEGQSFLTLNTYDRARFTYGFAQLAVHVPDGDFVLWLRDMIGRAEALDYFPGLGLVNGRIAKVEENQTVPFESAASTEPLSKYLNPTLESVEDEEVIAAAKFIHWTINHDGARALQVQHMVSTARRILKEADRKLGLDGVTADLCCLILDIRHQGRGTYPEMQKSLVSSSPFDRLLEIGCFSYPERCITLKEAMKSRRTKFQKKKWSREASDFI